jgi:protein-export membrane protein SecD
VRNGRLVAVLMVFVLAVAGLWAFIAVRGIRPQLGLDLQGGVSITLVPAPGQQVDDEILDQTVTVIRQRVDGLGVAEPEIARQGDTIVVQLPGVTDQQRAQEVIGRTAQLQFRPVLEIIPPDAPGYAEAGPACDQLSEAAPPAEEEVVLCERATTIQGRTGDPELPPDQRAKLRLGPVAVSGADVADAQATLDQLTGVSWVVDLDLEDRGAEAFQQITGQLACSPEGTVTRQLAIVLDGIVESAPPMGTEVLCEQGIGGGEAVITTGGGEDDARELALVLRTGALPIELEFATSQSVSPTLGADSLRAGLLAGAIGLALVAAYLIVLYRGIGLAAVAELAAFGALVVGLILLLGEYAGYSLTLAGVAGVVVSIGIAADSSIIYRERYRDELRGGRTVRTAADHAFANAFRTNLTGNFVSFLAAAVLYLLAVGPVRGFAFTLGLSTLVDTVVLATFTRALFGLLARSRRLSASNLMGLRRDMPQTPPSPAGNQRQRSKV